MEKTGLVLGGGGAKGSYQMGAWKAFRELDLSFDLIVGTSIGALNGALMAAIPGLKTLEGRTAPTACGAPSKISRSSQTATAGALRRCGSLRIRLTSCGSRPGT